MALWSLQSGPAFAAVAKPVFVALFLVAIAMPASAIPNWRNDGRQGYATRAEAIAIARDFVAKGAPRAGKGYVIFRDPDGGYTPVFHDKKPGEGPGV